MKRNLLFTLILIGALSLVILMAVGSRSAKDEVQSLKDELEQRDSVLTAINNSNIDLKRVIDNNTQLLCKVILRGDTSLSPQEEEELETYCKEERQRIEEQNVTFNPPDRELTTSPSTGEQNTAEQTPPEEPPDETIVDQVCDLLPSVIC